MLSVGSSKTTLSPTDEARIMLYNQSQPLLGFTAQGYDFRRSQQPHQEGRHHPPPKGVAGRTQPQQG